MRAIVLGACVALVCLGNAGHKAMAGDDRLDKIEPASPGWHEAVFRPSFEFPTKLIDEAAPWEQIDFSSAPAQYLEVVLAYFLDGQDRDTFRVQDNAVRKWYHAPWMGPTGNGREFVHGLTRERDASPYTLGRGQIACRQNWAVGFYNPRGGYAVGRYWAKVRDDKNGEPDMSALPFPVGTVVAKLLFTETTPEELPMLAGSPEWRAHITARGKEPVDACPAATVSATDSSATPRAIGTVRLLQLDVAVRDSRLDDSTGWVFGTFVFDGTRPGSDPWKKLAPVGLMWGNDPGIDDAAAIAGVRLSQSITLNRFDFPRPMGFGRGGRMNGPVDNPISSCMSCHATAQWPNPAALTPPAWSSPKCWFRNLRPTEAFGLPPADNVTCGLMPSASPITSLDYSLQLAAGTRNWAQDRQSHGKPVNVPLSFDALPALADQLRSEPVER